MVDSTSAEGERPVAGEEHHLTSAAVAVGGTVAAVALEGLEDEAGGDNSKERSPAKDSSLSDSSSDWPFDDGLSSIETSSLASSLRSEHITKLTHESTLGLSQKRAAAPTPRSSRWTADSTVPTTRRRPPRVAGSQPGASGAWTSRKPSERATGRRCALGAEGGG